MKDNFAQSEASTLDNEHSVQIQMINLLTRAVNENYSDSKKIEIIDQLISFTQIHFMSEKLVMRQHSFPGYDEHENEHDALIERLNELRLKVSSSASGLDLHTLNELRNMLLNHIATQDQRFSTFLTNL